MMEDIDATEIQAALVDSDFSSSEDEMNDVETHDTALSEFVVSDSTAQIADDDFVILSDESESSGSEGDPELVVDVNGCAITYQGRQWSLSDCAPEYVAAYINAGAGCDGATLCEGRLWPDGSPVEEAALEQAMRSSGTSDASTSSTVKSA